MRRPVGLLVIAFLVALSGSALASDEDAPWGEARATGFAGGEPSLAITSTGAMFLAAGEKTIRSQDGGESWTVVHDRYWRGDSTRPYTVDDAVIWADPVTDRIYVATVRSPEGCASIAWSDDEGDSWKDAETGCVLTGVNFQKIASGIPGPGTNPLAGAYATVAYMCYNKHPVAPLMAGGLEGVTACSASYDGGRTWPAERVVLSRTLHGCGGAPGRVAIGPDGTVVVASAAGCDAPRVGISADSGLTWRVEEGPTGAGAAGADPRLVFTPDGSLYMAWRGEDSATYISRAAAAGLPWDTPVRAAPEGVGSTMFASITGGSDGRVALAFLGTRDGVGDSSGVPDHARWHLFIAYADDALASGSLAFTQVTPEHDPVQIGPICYSGDSQCGGGRNLLDFIDSGTSPDGTFHVAFTDGCVDACVTDPAATAASSRSSQIILATLVGWNLFTPSGLEGALTEPNAMSADAAVPPYAFSQLALYVFAGGATGYLLWRLLVAIRGFTRLRRAGLLDHEKRKEIHDRIVAEPGLSFSDLKRRTDLANGALTHHVHTLERAGIIRRERDGFRVRYFVTGTASIVTPYATPVEARLLEAVRADPGVSQLVLAERIGVGRDSVAYHARKLSRRGLLESRVSGRRTEYYPKSRAMDSRNPSPEST